eukprot:1142212-Pelagomonas_calceolata.AAC.7
MALPLRPLSVHGAPFPVPRYLHLDLGERALRNIAYFRFHAHTLRVETSLWQEHTSACNRCGREGLQDEKHAMFLCSCDLALSSIFKLALRMSLTSCRSKPTRSVLEQLSRPSSQTTRLQYPPNPEGHRFGRMIRYTTNREKWEIPSRSRFTRFSVLALVFPLDFLPHGCRGLDQHVIYLQGGSKYNHVLSMTLT